MNVSRRGQQTVDRISIGMKIRPVWTSDKAVDAYQGRGIGTILLQRLLGAAWERDIRWFHFEFSARNVGMKHLIETVSHDDVDYAHQGAGCLTAQFQVPEPDRVSVIPALDEDSPFRRVLRNMASERIIARPRSTRPPPAK